MAEAPHTLSVQAAIAAQQSSEQGLSETEAARRLHTFGANKPTEKTERSAWLRLLSQFQNVLIYLLLASAGVSVALAHWVDASVIFGVVLINGIVGFVQEGKAERALRAIQAMARSRSQVVRDGQLRSIDSQDLVVGDIIFVQAGDRVPADARLIYGKDIRCDESALTGESEPTSKRVTALAPDTVGNAPANMLFMGTLITYGTGRALVWHTGDKTQLGTISHLVDDTEVLITPLQRQLTRFAQQLAIVIIIVSVLVATYGTWLQGHPLANMLQAAIGIAVASIPEGLPAIVTIALAIGVQIMARHHALVRQLPSVEVLGSVDIICSDKTGTLTTNTMTARRLVTASGSYQISGEGYQPEGKLLPQDNHSPEQDPALPPAFWVAMHCNDASLTQHGSDWELHGDPTEGALLVLAKKMVAEPNLLARLDELPFDAELRYMATLHQSGSAENCIAIKGAPEQLLSRADRQLGALGSEPIAVDHWQAAIAQLANGGMRVMALAYKPLPSDQTTVQHSDLDAGLTLLALVGISDPPRAEAVDSIRTCHSAGIRIKMITGDNPVTARAIGTELGLNTERVLTGAELDQLAPDALRAAAFDTDIFARTSPLNKLQLVRALQQTGHVVAMTGDGVNDAPALKQANIGVAMGRKGTDAAKDAADIVLTDDNFSTIARAVVQGRAVYDNIVKSILFTLPTSLAEATVITAAILLNTLLPITPAQILWINMITAITLALALAFEPEESGIMRRPPRPLNQGLITRPVLVRMLVMGGSAAALVFGLFFYYLSEGAALPLARSIAINTLVMIEALYLLSCRFLNHSLFSRRTLNGSLPSVLAIIAVIIIQFAFTYLPYSQQLFEVAPLTAHDWMFVVAGALPIVLIVELEKWFALRWRR